jgi:hypothetical protein
VRPPAWVLLTGEYPPDAGGVADYSSLVASGLAAEGHSVHVCSPAGGTPPPQPGVVHHPLPGEFGPRALQALEGVLAEVGHPRRLLVQYVPHAYGYRALNLALCLWLYRRRQRETIWTMFHEVAYPLQAPPWRKTNLLAAGHRVMAGLVLRASQRRLVAIPRWSQLLGRLGDPARFPCEWLPVPSNVGAEVDPQRVAGVRASLGASSEPVVVGHFGSYGRLIAPRLRAMLPRVLDGNSRTHLLLLGRSGHAFAAELRAAHARHAQRIHAPGGQPADVLPHSLAACDLFVQPYEDGVSSRRGSLMACLSLGGCVLTHLGSASESMWSESGAVALAAPEATVHAALELSSDPQRRAELGQRGARLYDKRFHLRHTLAALTRQS